VYRDEPQEETHGEGHGPEEDTPAPEVGRPGGVLEEGNGVEGNATWRGVSRGEAG
jgi:hypothetical protein